MDGIGLASFGLWFRLGLASFRAPLPLFRSLSRRVGPTHLTPPRGDILRAHTHLICVCTYTRVHACARREREREFCRRLRKMAGRVLANIHAFKKYSRIIEKH